MDRWIIKIKKVKKFLKGWGLSLKGHTRKYRRILREELSKLEKIEEDGMLPALLLERKTFIQSEILRLLEEEELYWHKRSNLTWLLKGDNNTGFFHRVANGKKRKNTIFSIHQNGEEIKEEDKILQHATDYYKELFGPSDDPAVSLDVVCWTTEEQISPCEHEELIKGFDIEEVKYAIFSMEKNTAPGPDHIPVEFFQICWEIIKGEIMEMFEEFSNNNMDIGRLNYGTITLILR